MSRRQFLRSSGDPRRLAALGLCASAPAIGACARDTTPPVIVDAEFEDVWTLVVQFSEPLAPVDEVDPVSHFRLGVGFWVEDLGITVYYDLGNHFPYGVPGSSGDLADSWQRHGLTLVTRVEAGDDASQLRLSLSYPVQVYACDMLAQAEALGIPAGIHLHYAEAGHPRVTDEAGNPLADIAAWWVPETGSSTRAGEFPELDPRMPIPCPPLP